MKKNKLNIIYLTTLIFLLSFSGLSCDKRCKCPETYAPVCGENGIEYGNNCWAECDKVSYIEGKCPN